MRVGFVFHSSGIAGAELAALELINFLSENGVHCYALLPKRGPLVRDLGLYCSEIRILPYRWWMGPQI